jgi:hypothetical protein
MRFVTFVAYLCSALLVFHLGALFDRSIADKEIAQLVEKHDKIVSELHGILFNCTSLCIPEVMP